MAKRRTHGETVKNPNAHVNAGLGSLLTSKSIPSDFIEEQPVPTPSLEALAEKVRAASAPKRALRFAIGRPIVERLVTNAQLQAHDSSAAQMRLFMEPAITYVQRSGMVDEAVAQKFLALHRPAVTSDIIRLLHESAPDTMQLQLDILSQGLGGFHITDIATRSKNDDGPYKIKSGRKRVVATLKGEYTDISMAERELVQTAYGLEPAWFHRATDVLKIPIGDFSLHTTTEPMRTASIEALREILIGSSVSVRPIAPITLMAQLDWPPSVN